MINVVESVNLGRAYGRKWALRECTLYIPGGCIAGLVGPNGAGKTTFLSLVMGLLKPTEGSLHVLGIDPVRNARLVLPKIGLVSQEHPLYKTFTVGEMLTWGRKMNRCWHDELARKRLERLGISLQQKIGKLSGGQKAQVALLMALSKQPELLILDEPVASLDPLARREFQQLLQEVVAEQGVTVIISSHIVVDLERFCDYLIILSASRVQISSPVEPLLQSHQWLVGPCEQSEKVRRTHNVLQSQQKAGQCSLLVEIQGTELDPTFQTQAASLEDIILAYLARPTASFLAQSTKVQEVAL